MIDRWQHVVLILGLAALAVLGFAIIPEHAYDKLGSALSIVVADPVGAVGAGVALGSTIGGLLAAYRRALKTPVPPVVVVTTPAEPVKEEVDE